MGKSRKVKALLAAPRDVSTNVVIIKKPRDGFQPNEAQREGTLRRKMKEEKRNFFKLLN